MNPDAPFKGSLARCKFGRNIGLRSPVLLAQIFLQDFSGCGLWQSLHELDGTWALEMGQTSAAELDQFRFAQLGSRFHDHQPFGDLTPFFVWDGYAVILDTALF